jgi:phosphopantothenoylcysteine decarboxylase/phosphopantothenate--cysteine ligase
MAAAVADFRPATGSAHKIKKQADGSVPPLALVQNPDVLAGLVTDPPRADGRQVVVGFAAETGDDSGGVLDHGRAKARRKGADLLAVNAVGGGRGFGAEQNALTILDRDGEVVATTEGSKDAVSDGLWDAVVRVLPA